MTAKFEPDLKAYNQNLSGEGTVSPYEVSEKGLTSYSDSQALLNPIPRSPITTAGGLQRQARPLRAQLLRTILPAVLLPLGVAGLVSYGIVAQRTQQQSDQLLQKEALLATEVFYELLQEAERIPATIATNPLIIDAVRSASKVAETQNLHQLSIDKVEQSFSATKLVKPNPALNTYLSQTTEISKFAELFLTEKHGFNVAYNNPTSDFVQSDEQWWQNTKNGTSGKFIEPKFDQSADTFGIELSQAIADPATSQFLGVVKGVISAEAFSTRLSNLIGDLNIARSQVIQLLALKEDGTLAVVNTIGTQQNRDNRELIGSEAVAQKAQALIQSIQAPNGTSEQGTGNAEASLKGLAMDSVTSESGEQLLRTKFEDKGRSYVLITVPKTNWVVAASVELSELKSTSRQAALTLSLMFLTLGGIITAAVAVLARRLATPLKQLANSAEQVISGNLDVQAQPVGVQETQVLAQVFNNLLTQVRGLLREQVNEAEQARLFEDIAASRARTSQDLEQVFNRAVQGALRILNVDRVVVYRFYPDWRGYISSEAVVPDWPEALGDKIEDPCIGEHLVEAYRRGRVVATNNVYEAGFHPDHLRLMARLKIQANLVTPILKDERLFGLLIAHHCAAPHVWQEFEVNFLKELAIRVGIALDRVTFQEQAEQAREKAERLAFEQRQQKETLQQQLLELLSDIEGVARGDLTVRADVTVGEIGTVADFFNAVVESLRAIVTQVKQAATQVNTSLGENEAAIRQLSSEALKQAEETTRTLDSVQAMTSSIQEVAENAREAAAVAHTASTTAVRGGMAMDRTVENIFMLRETVGDTAKKVKRLGESSQRISKVASLIEQIAMQTKLLAINAGIEAAIAGEQGQGFAVVAEQVGELAARAGRATKEIEQLVESIQQETAEVVEAMEVGTSQVVEGTQLVEEAKQSLSQMLEVSRHIDQLVQSISSATVSQVETSQIVTDLMQEIALISERTSNSSRQVSTSLQETVEIARELQSSVSTFTVDD